MSDNPTIDIDIESTENHNADYTTPSDKSEEKSDETIRSIGEGIIRELSKMSLPVSKIDPTGTKEQIGAVSIEERKRQDGSGYQQYKIDGRFASEGVAKERLANDTREAVQKSSAKGYDYLLDRMRGIEDSAPTEKTRVGTSDFRGPDTPKGWSKKEDTKPNLTTGKADEFPGVPILGQLPGAGLASGVGKAAASAAGAIGVSGIASAGIGLAVGAGAAALGYEALPYIQGGLAKRDVFRRSYIEAEEMEGQTEALQGKQSFWDKIGVPVGTTPESIYRKNDAYLADRREASKQNMKDDSLNSYEQHMRKELEKQEGIANDVVGVSQVKAIAARKARKKADTLSRRIEAERDPYDQIDPESNTGGIQDESIPDYIDPEEYATMGTLGLLGASLRAREINTKDRRNIDTKWNRYSKQQPVKAKALYGRGAHSRFDSLYNSQRAYKDAGYESPMEQNEVTDADRAELGIEDNGITTQTMNAEHDASPWDMKDQQDWIQHKDTTPIPNFPSQGGPTMIVGNSYNNFTC